MQIQITQRFVHTLCIAGPYAVNIAIDADYINWTSTYNSCLFVLQVKVTSECLPDIVASQTQVYNVTSYINCCIFR